MKMPEPKFSSWHGEHCKTLLNPTGVCNAFTWPPRIPEDEYWTAKGYHGEPLYTAEQMKQYGRDLLEEAAKEAFDADHMGSVNLKLMKNRIGNAIRKLKETL